MYVSICTNILLRTYTACTYTYEFIGYCAVRIFSSLFVYIYVPVCFFALAQTDGSIGSIGASLRRGLKFRGALGGIREARGLDLDVLEAPEDTPHDLANVLARSFGPVEILGLAQGARPSSGTIRAFCGPLGSLLATVRVCYCLAWDSDRPSEAQAPFSAGPFQGWQWKLRP